MKNKISFYKNLSFILFLFIGVSYLILLDMLIFKNFPGFIMQVILLLDALKNKTNISHLIQSPDTIITWIGFIISIIFLIKIIKAVFTSYKSYKDTKLFINSIQVIKQQGDKFFIVDYIEHLAFTTGFLKPKVFLSNNLENYLNNLEMESIRLHELNHVKSLDPLKGFILQFIRNILPYFPNKQNLFNNYDILTELAADKFVEDSLKTKRGIISALSKIMEFQNTLLNINVSTFKTQNDRIKILVGKEKFYSKYLFLMLFIISSFFMINILALKNANIFTECQHIVECFQTLFSKTSTISIEDKSMCMSSDSYSSQYHCIKFIEIHSPISSSNSGV